MMKTSSAPRTWNANIWLSNKQKTYGKLYLNLAISGRIPFLLNLYWKIANKGMVQMFSYTFLPKIQSCICLWTELKMHNRRVTASSVCEQVFWWDAGERWVSGGRRGEFSQAKCKQQIINVCSQKPPETPKHTWSSSALKVVTARKSCVQTCSSVLRTGSWKSPLWATLLLVSQAAKCMLS